MKSRKRKKGSFLTIIMLQLYFINWVQNQSRSKIFEAIHSPDPTQIQNIRYSPGPVQSKSSPMLISGPCRRCCITTVYLGCLTPTKACAVTTSNRSLNAVDRQLQTNGRRCYCWKVQDQALTFCEWFGVVCFFSAGPSACTLSVFCCAWPSRNENWHKRGRGIMSFQ